MLGLRKITTYSYILLFLITLWVWIGVKMFAQQWRGETRIVEIMKTNYYNDSSHLYQFNDRSVLQERSLEVSLGLTCQALFDADRNTTARAKLFDNSNLR